MQRGKIFTAVAWGLGGLFLCAAAAVGFATQGFGLAELPDPQPEDWAQAYTTTWDTEEDPVRGLDISWFHGPVELRVGEGQYVTVTEEAQQELPEEDRLELTSSGGVLRIKWNSQLLALDLLEHNSKALIVEVPRETAEDLEELRCQAVSGLVTVSGFAAGEMELSSDSGGLALSDLRAGELRLSTISGPMTLRNAQVEDRLEAYTTAGAAELSQVAASEVKLTAVSGAMAFQGQAGELWGDSISGAVNIALAQCPQAAKLRSVSGGLTLALPENDGFEAAFSSVSGRFQCQFPASGDKGPKGRALYGSGGAQLEFSTTTGDIRLLRSSPAKTGDQTQGSELT